MEQTQESLRILAGATGIKHYTTFDCEELAEKLGVKYTPDFIYDTYCREPIKTPVRVSVSDIGTGREVAAFHSIYSTAQRYGVSPGTIHRCMKNKNLFYYYGHLLLFVRG